MLKTFKDRRPAVYYGLACSAIAFLISALALLPYVVQSGGALTLTADFNFQQIPFEMAVSDALSDRDGEWLWSLDLGTSLVNGFSFYNLGSPFMWLIFLFGKNAVPYMMAPAFVLKYVTAAVGAYLFICYFVKDRRYAVLGGILYAFSGFQNYNLIFFHFHDAVAMFPFLLIGLEEFLRKRRKFPFALAVAVNCLTNYFFFFGEVLFLMAYYVIRYWADLKKDWKARMPEALGCFGLGATGVLAAGILFIPAAVYILNGSRIAMVPAGRNFVEFYLRNVKGFLFPVDIMGGQFVLNTEEWWSTSCWLPFIGIAFPVAYCVKNRDWLSNLIVIFGIVSFVQPLNSLFYLFAEYEFKRWWYMFVMFLALAAAKSMDSRIERKYVRVGVIANSVAIALFWAFALSLSAFGAVEGVNDVPLAVVNTVLALAMPCAAAWLFLWDWAKAAWRQLAAVSICGCLCTMATLGLYRRDTDAGSDMLALYQCSLRLDTDFIDGTQYRTDSSSNSVSLVSGAPGLVSFCSTVSDPIVKFYSMFDILRAYSSPDPHIIPGLVELLGGRYHVSTVRPNNDNGTVTSSAYGDMGLYVTEQRACPIGFAMDSYVTVSELFAFDVMDRAVVMLGNLVVDDEDEDLVSGVLEHELSPDLDHSDGRLQEHVDRAESRKVLNFVRDGDGFRCRTDYDAGTAVFFSVPNDPGWTVRLDGMETETVDAAGMACVVVPAGNHDIEFSYRTPGLDAGVTCSIAGCAGLLALGALDLRDIRKRRRS